MSVNFKTSGNISVREINQFIRDYSNANIPNENSAKSVEDTFVTMDNNWFDLVNGDANRPHLLSEAYGVAAPPTAWTSPKIACWARIEWDGTEYYNVPLCSREYNISNSSLRDDKIMFKFTRYSYDSDIGNNPGGRFVTYRATSYGKDAGVQHPLPPEIKNESRKYGLLAVNSYWDWACVGPLRAIVYGACTTDPNSADMQGPVQHLRSTYLGTRYLWTNRHTDPSSTIIWSSKPGTQAFICNAQYSPDPPNPESKTVQEAFVYWDTNDIPYAQYAHGWKLKLVGNTEEFWRHAALSNQNINGVLTAQSTDFHLKITGASTSSTHISLETGSYESNNNIFDEYKTIYYQTGLVYIRDNNTTSSDFGVTFNHDKCANGYMKIEVGASPEFVVLPYGSQWIVIQADGIIPSGDGYTISIPNASYSRTFSNKSAAVSHWQTLHFDEHFYQMNTNSELYFYGGSYFESSLYPVAVPGRDTKYFNGATKYESDWCFYITQRTKGVKSDVNYQGTTYDEFDKYADDQGYITSSSISTSTKSYDVSRALGGTYNDTFYASTCENPRWKGSKYKFDLLYDAYRRKQFYVNLNNRLANEQYMPRMHTGLKIEVKYIIELRMAHQIQIERAVRYCEKLSGINSFQTLYVWPFNEDFATVYGATAPTPEGFDEEEFFIIGHSTAESDIKYLHIETKYLNSSTNLYNDAITAIRNAFSV